LTTEPISFVDIPVAAREVHVSCGTVKKLIRDGDLPSTRIRDRRLIARPHLEQFKRDRLAEAGVPL
jgi:excisionase family DNA binding protein